MESSLHRLAVPVAALAPLLGAGSAAAAEITLIQYDLSGVVNFSSPWSFTQPVYSSSAPGPGGIGSTVTFLFDSESGQPIVSGNVTILTFVQSNAMTVSPYVTGYLRQTLLSPGITGGHLTDHTPFLTGRSGLANRYGFVHCQSIANAYLSLIGQLLLSYPHPQTRLGTPVGGTVVAGSGWVFNTDFTSFQAARSTRMGRQLYLRGTANLVGTEISRTVITPEPPPWALLATSLLAVIALVVRPLRSRERLR